MSPVVHKDDPESFWERMRMIHGEDVGPKPKRGGLMQHKIETAADDHVHIMIRTPEEPEKNPIDLDINNRHGRRVMGVRANGMTIGSLLLDVKELDPSHTEESRLQRFCPYCGMPSTLISSSSSHHECEPEESWRAKMVKIGDRLASRLPDTAESEAWWDIRRRGT